MTKSGFITQVILNNKIGKCNNDEHILNLPNLPNFISYNKIDKSIHTIAYITVNYEENSGGKKFFDVIQANPN